MIGVTGKEKGICRERGTDRKKRQLGDQKGSENKIRKYI